MVSNKLIDMANIMFEVKERAFFVPYETRSINFEFSWLKTFSLYKVEAFDIVLGN